jgi:hypothetical protein
MNHLPKRVPYGRTAAGLAIGALLLSACGGGSDDAAVTPTDPLVAGTEVPQSATTSSTAAFAFVQGVAANRDETASPLVVGDAVLATSDTDEPDPGV